MKLYHGSNQEIIKPLHNGSREKTDFGKGFYLNQDKKQAQRWSIRGNTPIVNCYNLELEVLQTYEFELGLEWLLFIIYNRQIGEFNREVLKQRFQHLEKMDVIIGPTADDRMYNTLEEFFDGDLSLEKALDILNCMHLSKQYLVKSKKGIAHTIYEGSYELISPVFDEVVKDNHLFMSSVRDQVKGYQRRQYEKQTYIEEIQKEVEDGTQ